MCESHLSHRGKGGPSVVSCFLEHKGCGSFLTSTVFQDHKTQVKFIASKNHIKIRVIISFK